MIGLYILRGKSVTLTTSNRSAAPDNALRRNTMERTTPMKRPTLFATTLTLAALSMTACGQSSPTQESSNEPVASTAPAAETQGNYLEFAGAPGLTEDQLNGPIQEGIQDARAQDAPFFINREEVYWLKADIPYAERILVEEEAAKASDSHPVRWVDGFGSGTLTFYRHDDPVTYTLSVDPASTPSP